MDLHAKPAHKDKTLGTALGAAAVLLGYADNQSENVQIAAFIAAGLVVAAAIVGRFKLRTEAVSSAAIVHGEQILLAETLPPIDEDQEGYDDE